MLGYVVLHPVAMVIFHLVDPQASAAASLGSLADVWGPIAHSFGGEMLPMGGLFAVLGATISTGAGLLRLSVMRQRDRLRRQLDVNDEIRGQLSRRAALLQDKNRELEELEHANRRASRFIVHNFKTSLSCIRGFTAHLLELPAVKGDTTLEDPLRRIDRQARRMTGAVSDLLDMARLGEGCVLERGEVEVAQLLRDATSVFAVPPATRAPSLGERHATCPSVWGDRRLLQRVLTNLIENAVKHNRPDTEVVIDADSRGTREGVIFSCSDDGEGIADEVAPFVFKEFVSTGVDGGQSSGLGLSFCKAVVEAHGGRIWFETSLGAGTRVLFTVPKYEEACHAE